MPFSCATCCRVLSTERSLDRHVRRFHPTQKEEQVICKTCNSPYSDKYTLKIHNTRTHGDENPALNISPTRTSEEANTSTNIPEVTEQEEQSDCCKSVQKIFAENHKKFVTSMLNTEVHTLQESTRMNSPVKTAELSYTTPIKTEEIPTEEISQEFNPQISIISLQDSGDESQTIINGYTENLLELAITQQKNTDFINQNTSHLLKLLEITKQLVIDFEKNKKYQTRNLKSKTYNCRICNRMYENSASLANHKSKYHRVKSTTDCTCRQCNAVFNSETNLAIHRYRCHRVSL